MIKMLVVLKNIIATQLVFYCLMLFSTISHAEKLSFELVNQKIKISDRQHEVQAPKNYVLELISAELNRPRMMSFTQDKELLIGSSKGKIYRLRPPYQHVEVLVDVGGFPHSVAVRDQNLYVAKNDGVYQAAYQAGKTLKKKDFQLFAALPGGGGHSSRTIAIGPDNKIYVSLGISGNCSNQYVDDSYKFKQRRGGIMRLNEKTDPPSWESFASGLRNPIGFTWQPNSSAIYVTNNGPDHWGYEQPGEYFSRAEAGSFHGMPWFQFDGAAIQRDRCIKSEPPRTDVTVPEVTFPARHAPMGVTFVTSGHLENDAIVALHGSWATLPDGGFGGDPATRRPPKLVVVRFQDQHAKQVEDFVTGFQLDNGTRWARPVDVVFGPDKAIYFTSDSGVNGLFRLRKKDVEE